MSAWGGRVYRVAGEVADVDASGRLLAQFTGRDLELLESLTSGYDGAVPFVRRVGAAAVVRFSGKLSSWVPPSRYRPREAGLVSQLYGAPVTVGFRVIPYAFQTASGKIEGISFKLTKVEVAITT